jgi:hypothetical protein
MTTMVTEPEISGVHPALDYYNLHENVMESNEWKM